MPLVVTSVPNLAQGVSQQPDNLRYPGQCDEQVNAWATVVEGLVKRPNTRWVREFNSGAIPAGSSDLFTHFVKRDEDNKYCVQVSLGGVGVIDLDNGINIPVTVTSIASSYLGLGTSITNPLKDIRALTVADYTFLVNKKKTVLKDNALLSDPPQKEALVTVNLGDYEKAYSVYIDDVLVPVGGVANDHDYDHLNTGGLSNWQPATYISGASNLSKHADTEFLAKELAACISESYASERTGVNNITFTNGGSGWLENLYRKDLDSALPSYVPTKLVFEVLQNSPDPDPAVSSTFENRSAKGTCDVLAGVIQSFNLTSSGSNYDKTQTTPGTYDYPLTLELTELGFYNNKWVRLSRIQQTVAPSGLSFGVDNIDPYLIDREGSVIRIKKTLKVSNSGAYYLLKEEHVSSSDKEPGVGSDWERYWKLVTVSAGATAWQTGFDYFITSDFTVRTTDGLANQGLTAIYKEIPSITDLPKQCFNNFEVKIIGDADIDQDDYYVKFKTKDAREFGEGTWVETVGWKNQESVADLSEPIEIKLKPETMPIVLVLQGDGTFRLQTPEEDETAIPPFEKGWRSRGAGDDDTNPFPSFVGSTINDVFFFKNRLGFITDSNVIFSEADEYFNFFRTTTQQLLDSAPIDVGLSHTKVAVLQHALPFQEKLMLFSDNSQFVLRGADVLSPKTVAISPVTEYDISDGISPLALGPYIYFPFNRGQYEGMFEYFVDNNTEVFEAEEITSQVPKYIPTSIKRMAGSASESMLVLQSANDPKTLFVYKYFWSGKEKIQSAWQKWTFDDAITGFDFIDSTLYLILNGIQLVEMPVENALTDTGLDYTLLLDNRIDGAVATVNYDDQTNRTTISNLPDGYAPTSEHTVFTKGGSERKIVNVSFGDIEIEGFLASYVKYEGVIYKCGTNHASSLFTRPDTSPFWSVSTEVPNAPAWTSEGAFYNNEKYFFVGKPYNMLYRFSNQALKQPTERGGRSASDYTYQTIRNASIEYADTGHFTVEVTPRFRDKYTYVYNPALLSSISTLDRFTPESGHFRFGVQCRPEEATIEVKSSSALPVKLLAAEFESMVTGRSRRYGA